MKYLICPKMSYDILFLENETYVTDWIEIVHVLIDTWNDFVDKTVLKWTESMEHLVNLNLWL